MGILSVCLTLTMCFVYAGTSNSNCITNKQIIEENVKNCIEINHHHHESRNLAPEKAVSNALYDLKSSELSEKSNIIYSNNNPSSLGRKMKMSMNMIQYMIVPGFLMAGILPWIMPGLQMAVSMLSMVNNMAFTSGLVALVRSYVFDKEPDEHVVYVNHGYKSKNQGT